MGYIKLPYWITKDKRLHFVFGFMIFFLSAALFDWLIGFILVLTAAVTKEFYDLFKKKTVFDWKDILFTILIPLIVYLITLI